MCIQDGGIRRKQNRMLLVQYDTGSVLGVTPGDRVFFGLWGTAVDEKYRVA